MQPVTFLCNTRRVRGTNIDYRHKIRTGYLTCAVCRALAKVIYEMHLHKIWLSRVTLEFVYVTPEVV